MEFAFECFESRSNGWNLHSNASNPIRMVGNCIQTLRIQSEWFEFAFEWFESQSNGAKLQSNGSNGSNPVRMVQIVIRIA